MASILNSVSGGRTDSQSSLNTLSGRFFNLMSIMKSRKLIR